MRLQRMLRPRRSIALTRSEGALTQRLHRRIDDLAENHRARAVEDPAVGREQLVLVRLLIAQPCFAILDRVSSTLRAAQLEQWLRRLTDNGISCINLDEAAHSVELYDPFWRSATMEHGNGSRRSIAARNGARPSAGNPDRMTTLR
jgi:hypothetical protein